MTKVDLNVDVHHLARVEGHGNIKVRVREGKLAVIYARSNPKTSLHCVTLIRRVRRALSTGIQKQNGFKTIGKCCLKWNPKLTR